MNVRFWTGHGADRPEIQLRQRLITRNPNTGKAFLVLDAEIVSSEAAQIGRDGLAGLQLLFIMNFVA